MWTIKKVEHWRTDDFELWCWRRLLIVPWKERSNQCQFWRKSTLNIHWKDWRWSWSSNTLAIWCEEPTHWKRPKCWERLRMTEDEMVGWHHRFNGHEFEQTPGDSEGQKSLVCYSPLGCKQLDTTKWLHNKPYILPNKVFFFVGLTHNTWCVYSRYTYGV